MIELPSAAVHYACVRLKDIVRSSTAYAVGVPEMGFPEADRQTSNCNMFYTDIISSAAGRLLRNCQ
jgi:hypothetical protein